MELKSGDWVRTEAGEIGHVVYVARLTVFVQIEPPPDDKRLKAFLASTLTKTDPPSGLAKIFLSPLDSGRAMEFAQLFNARTCPVCGNKLNFTPWEGTDFKDTSCDCCGIHFGYDDLIECSRDGLYRAWRDRWVTQGMPWCHGNPPPDYNPAAQFANLQQLLKRA